MPPTTQTAQNTAKPFISNSYVVGKKFAHAERSYDIKEKATGKQLVVKIFQRSELSQLQLDYL
jgi:hypothetical protein